jgi:hypothetical protein
VTTLSDLSSLVLVLFGGVVARCNSGRCDTELLRIFEMLLRRDRLGRSIASEIVSDLLGISILPVAAKVCEGNSSGSTFRMGK